MFGKFLVPAAAILCAVPAAAAVSVIGTSSARLCYLAADSGSRGGIRQMDECNRALNEEALTDYEIVATHVNRGILRLRQGSLNSALTDFDAAIAMDPNQPEAYLNKAAALMRQPNGAGAALPLFTAALENKTRKPALAYFGRGLAHEELGDVKAAYFDYKRANAADPEWDQPRTKLARFSIKRN